MKKAVPFTKEDIGKYVLVVVTHNNSMIILFFSTGTKRLLLYDDTTDTVLHKAYAVNAIAFQDVTERNQLGLLSVKEIFGGS